MKRAIKEQRLYSRRGVTITEVVIALVLISIISAASLSVVMFAVNVENNSFSAVEAANSAENAIACFRYAENEEEFLQALCKSGAYTKEEDGRIVLKGTDHTVTIRADYTAYYFEYSAVSTDGEEIYSFRYPYDPSAGGAL